jgi:hypothetical protein
MLKRKDKTLKNISNGILSNFVYSTFR